MTPSVMPSDERFAICLRAIELVAEQWQREHPDEKAITFLAATGEFIAQQLRTVRPETFEAFLDVIRARYREVKAQR